MEERFADGADDNRQYLPYGQLGRPGSSLDMFDPSGFNQYGNWAFLEYLGERFGNDVVRAVWRQAGAYDGAPDRYSVAALRRVLARHGGLAAGVRGVRLGRRPLPPTSSRRAPHGRRARRGPGGSAPETVGRAPACGSTISPRAPSTSGRPRAFATGAGGCGSPYMRRR